MWLFTFLLLFSGVQAHATSCRDTLLGLSDSLAMRERVGLVGSIRTTSQEPACGLPALASALPAAGTGEFVVTWGGSGNLDTSFHGHVLVRSGAVLFLKPGQYRIASLVLEWGSQMVLDTTGDGVSPSLRSLEVMVQGPITWLDGAYNRVPGASDSLAASRVWIGQSGNGAVSFAAGCQVRAHVWAPLTAVSFGDRASLWGQVLARSLTLGYDFQGRYAASVGVPSWESKSEVRVEILSPTNGLKTNAQSLPVTLTCTPDAGHTDQVG